MCPQYISNLGKESQHWNVKIKTMTQRYGFKEVRFMGYHLHISNFTVQKVK